MRAALPLLAGTLLAGCASQTALLLPGEPGHPVGALAVIGQRGKPPVADPKILEEANEAAALSGAGATLKRNVAVKPAYVELMAGLPRPAVPFTLKYQEGKDIPDDSPENLQTIEDIKLELASRPGAEVQVTGFTDRVGDETSNLTLSQNRADKFKAKLLGLGFPPDAVSAIGRGELDPVVPTADRVPNAENRRIVVIVR